MIEALLALYNADVLPSIPAKGSVGASGDLAPLAHMSAGAAWAKVKYRSAAPRLRQAKGCAARDSHRCRSPPRKDSRC